ncbi:MAG: ATP-binding protein [Planctomycetota bacterium]
MPASLRLTAAPTLPEVTRIAAEVRAFLSQHAVGTEAAYVCDLAIEEVLTNVVRHGGTANAGTPFDVEVKVDATAVELLVRDRGIAFDPTAAPPPRSQGEDAGMRTGGRGLTLLRRMTERLEYARAGDENRLRIRIARGR